VAEILLRDVSRAGHELGRATLGDLPARLHVRELVARRIRTEVAAYNADPGRVYVGFVQPEDAIRYRHGHHMRRPRRLDAERFVLAAEQAVDAGLLRFEVDGEPVTDLDAELDLEGHDEVVAVLARPVVARDPTPR
jgi:hypothetical protein